MSQPSSDTTLEAALQELSTTAHSLEVQTTDTPVFPSPVTFLGEGLAMLQLKSDPQSFSEKQIKLESTKEMSLES